MLIGTILMVSIFWSYVLQGFNLTTSLAPKEWSKTETILLVISFTLMVGAAYYNKILDLIIGFLSKFNLNQKQ